MAEITPIHETIFPQVLCKWIEDSLKTGAFPDSVKSIEIALIHEKVDLFDKENYRPISILTLISKVFEKIIYSQVYSYMQLYLNTLLCEFRQGHGTQHALFRLLQTWQKELDESGYTGTVLMDLSKAYDCLPHDLIIAKFEAYGFDNTSLRLFHNYFSNRKQRVKIGSLGYPKALFLVLSYSIFLLTISLCLLKKLTFATLRMIILYTNLVRACR